MPGLSDYAAQNALQYLTGNRATPALPSVWCALFTAAPTSDAGTGGTEVSGGAYARVQVAGALAATATFTTGSPNITMTTNPGWILPGFNVYDATNGFQIGTVSTFSGTALVLTANAAHASSGSTDSLIFSAWPAATASVGTEPSVTPASVANGGAVNFAAATASWGTVVAFGLYDAVTAGNLLAFDYLGNFAWQPVSMSTASPGVITGHAHGYSAADPVVVTAKYGGAIPTFSQSNLTGVLAVVGPTTDTFTVTNGGTAVNTSGSGDFSVRKIVQQSIPSGVTASFAAASLTLNLA